MFIPLWGRYYRTIAFIVVAIIFVNPSAFSQGIGPCVFPDKDRAKLVTVVGEARTITRKGLPSQLMYCEYHFSHFLASNESGEEQRSTTPVLKSYMSHVEYYAPDGSLIVKKVVDFSHSQFSPDVYQEDMRHGERRLSQRLPNNEGYRLRYLPPNANRSIEKEVMIKSKDNMVADAGFDNAIRSQWDNILSGDKKIYTFLATPGLRTIDLKVRRLKPSACEQWGIDRHTQVCLRVSSASLWINLFIKPITLIYEREGQRLIFFNGTVNISNDKGKQQRASIRYFYSSLESLLSH